MNFAKLPKSAWQAFFCCKCNRPIQAIKYSTRFAFLACWLFLLTIVPVIAAAAQTPVLTFYEAGKTVSFRVSDLVETRIKPVPNSELSDFVIELTPSMAPSTAAFTSDLIGRQIAGIFDGRVWFSNITVTTSGPMRVVQFLDRDSATLDILSSRLKVMRQDAGLRIQPIIILFENIRELTIMPGDIAGAKFDGDVARIHLNLPAQNKLADLAGAEQQNSWHLALGDQVIDEWQYIISEGKGLLILTNVDQQTIDMRNLKSQPLE